MSQDLATKSILSLSNQTLVIPTCLTLGLNERSPLRRQKLDWGVGSVATFCTWPGALCVVSGGG